MTLTNDNYNEAVQTHSSASGTVVIDLTVANVHRVEAIDNITFDIQNASTNPTGNSVLIYVVDSDGGGPYTLSWPTSVVFANSTVVGEVTQSSNVEIGLVSDDGGTEWRARKTGGRFA